MAKQPRFLRSTVLLALLLAAPLVGIELYEEKPISRIQIEFDSPDQAGTFDPKPVLSKLKTKEGDQFSQLTFDNDLKALSEQYDKVQPAVRVQDGQVVIVIHITPRPVIHQIRFAGNQKVSTSTLQKELDIQPYTVFNRQEFNKAFNKLKEYYLKRGYFESQLSYTIEQIPNSNEIDVAIEINEGKSGNIKKIVLKGFTKAEQKEIEEAMYLKKYNFLTSWLTGQGTLRDEALEQDRTTIMNYLHNRGYADACVDIQILDAPGSDKIIVEISAERGSLYRLGSLQIQGNSLISTEEILKKSSISEGSVFSPDKIRDASTAIKDLYGQKGYIDASVQYETCLRENEPVFDVEFSIDEGQQYKIGMIHIFGNHSTQCNVILRESLLVPGETFDARKLKATQQRLEAIGYFKSVNVYAVRTTDDIGLGENYRDVYVEVEETSTGSVSLFMGFSSSDSVFGGLDLTERNFNLAGLTRAFAGKFSSLRGGGQYFHMRGTLGKKEDNFLVSWVNPYMNDSLWRFGVEISTTFSTLQSDDEKSRTYGGSVFANYPLSSYWTGGFRQRLRHTSNTLDLDQAHATPEEISVAETRNDAKGLISALSANLAYDSSDRAYKPRKGWRSYLEGEFVGVGGSYHFWKLSYLNTLYFPVTQKGTFKLRGEFRFISPFGSKSHVQNVPYSERFFLGGEGSVRGYKPFILGPHILQTNTPLGGLSSSLLSLEYNYELLKIVDLFAFFDAGNVSFDTWRLPFADLTLRCSTGVGLRLEINKGTPIMIGWGYPINPERSKDRQKFFFSMGGQF